MEPMQDRKSRARFPSLINRPSKRRLYHFYQRHKGIKTLSFTAIPGWWALQPAAQQARGSAPSHQGVEQPCTSTPATTTQAHAPAQPSDKPAAQPVARTHTGTEAASAVPGASMVHENVQQGAYAGAQEQEQQQGQGQPRAARHKRGPGWRCTIELSGGRINDSTPLPTLTISAEGGTKKDAEVAASQAALDELGSRGLLTAHTLAPLSHNARWTRPGRRTQGSPLVYLDMAVRGTPAGRLVLELFEDQAPHTITTLTKLFDPPHSHPSTHSCTTAPSSEGAAEREAGEASDGVVGSWEQCLAAASYSGSCVTEVRPRAYIQLSPPPALQHLADTGSVYLAQPVAATATAASWAPSSTNSERDPCPGQLAAAGSMDAPAADNVGASEGDGGGGRPQKDSFGDLLESLMNMQEANPIVEGEGEGEMLSSHTLAPAGQEEEGGEEEEAGGEKGDSALPHQGAASHQLEEVAGPVDTPSCSNPSSNAATGSAPCVTNSLATITAQAGPNSPKPGSPISGHIASGGISTEHSAGRLPSRHWQLIHPGEGGGGRGAASGVHQLGHNRVLRVSVPLSKEPLQQASLCLTTHPNTELDDSHMVVGQVVRGHGTLRALLQVPTNRSNKPLMRCEVVGCGVMPRDTNITTLPAPMEGQYPVFPEDLAPSGLHPPDGVSETDWRCDLANTIKEAGNAAFQEQCWREAHALYSQGIRYLDWTSLSDPDNMTYQGKVAMQAVEHTLRLNRAAAAIKLVQTKALEPGTGQGSSSSSFFVPTPLAIAPCIPGGDVSAAFISQALLDVQTVLNRRPGHAKALFRQGQIYMVAGRFEEAVPILRHASTSAAAGDTSAATALQAAEEGARRSRKERGAAYTRALSRSGQEQTKGCGAGEAQIVVGAPSCGSTSSTDGLVERAVGKSGPDALQIPAPANLQLKELKRQARMFDRLFAHVPCPAVQMAGSGSSGWLSNKL